MNFAPRSAALLVAVVGLAAVLPAMPVMADEVEPLPSPAARLLAAYPGLGASEWNGRITGFHGKPMGSGATDADAASEWLAANAGAFGAGALDLRLSRVDEVSYGKFTSFVYDQYVDGLPVEFGRARVLVLNRAAADAADAPVGANAVRAMRHDVVLVSGRLAAAPIGGLAPASIAPETAVANVRAIPAFAGLTDFAQPELAVFFGEGDFDAWVTPVRVWKFVGEDPRLETRVKRTFFVDAATGELVAARNDVLNIDVQGTIQGRATPYPLGNAGPDIAANPPILQAVPGARAQQTGGGQDFTNLLGAYLIPFAGGGSATVTTTLASLETTSITDIQGEPILTASATGAVTGAINLTLNPTPTEFRTAQVNAAIHLHLTRDHFRSRAPGFTGLDAALPAKVNITTASGITYCNAFYDGASTNYFRVGGGCNNTAFSSVIAHEYGHHIVNRLGLAQGAFGEGFGDTMSMMIYDDAIIGRNFTTSGGIIRTPDTANVQYPCSGAIHFCGQVLGGALYEIRKNLGARYGSLPGLDVARQLHIDWALITAGGQGTDSAHPTTAIEFLTVDDTDGNLANGTPNYCQIAAGFTSHGISSPAVTASAEVTFPGGLPANVLPGVPTSFQVDVDAGAATVTGGTLFSRQGSVGAFASSALAPLGGGGFDATLPASLCGADLQYYVTITTSSGSITFPDTACNQPLLSVPVASSISIVNDAFEVASGWTVGGLAGSTTAISGLWTRVDPVGTAAQPELDHSDPGSFCYVTGQGVVGGGLGDNDVDGGVTVLTSPAFNIAGTTDGTVSYWRWYSNDTGGAPNADVFRVEVSTNNGGTWTPAETVGPAGAGTSGGWLPASFTLASKGLAPTAQVRVRFIAGDLGTGSLIEAAVDDVRIVGKSCENPSCGDTDFDGDGDAATDADIEAFFSVIGGLGCPTASCDSTDFDGDGDEGTDADIEAFFRVIGGGPCTL